MKKITQKISALLVLGLFLVGMVPLASAESDIDRLNKAVLKEYANWKEASNRMHNVLTKDMANAQNVVNKLKNIKYIDHENAEQARDAFQDLMEGSKREIEFLIDLTEKSKPNKDHQYLYDALAAADEVLAIIDGINPETATREDLNNVLDGIRDFWNFHFKITYYKAIGEAGSARIRYALNKLDVLDDKLEVMINNVKAEGYDTRDAEAWLVDYRNKLAKAESDYDKLKDAWGEVNTRFDIPPIYNAYFNYLKGANSKAKEMYSLAQDIYKDLKSQKPLRTVNGVDYTAEKGQAQSDSGEPIQRKKPLATVNGNQFIVNKDVTGTPVSDAEKGSR
jgi:hypothetical protein